MVPRGIVAPCKLFPNERRKTSIVPQNTLQSLGSWEVGKEWVAEEQVTNHTFHDIHQGSHISFLDDAAVFAIFHGVHTIHNLLDLRQLQVLHEVIVKDGLFYEILWPKAREGGVIDTSDQPSIVLGAQRSHAVLRQTMEESSWKAWKQNVQTAEREPEIFLSANYHLVSAQRTNSKHIGSICFTMF